jgi:hypothetical protein
MPHPRRARKEINRLIINSVGAYNWMYMAEPVFVGLLFADHIITEKNNKKGIIGTFSKFYTPRFPARFPPWHIYAAVTNLIGEHDFSINLVYDKAQQVIVPINGKIKADEASAVVELTFRIDGAMFPEEGKYILTFNVDGAQVGSRVLEVLTLPQSGG